MAKLLYTQLLMAILEASILLIEAAALVAVAATLAMSYRQMHATQQQMRTMQTQLAVTRDSGKAENMLHALSVLRDPEFRTAVMVVRNRLKGRGVESWESGDAMHVLLVCSTYNLLGLLIKHQVVPAQVFLEHWGSSVIDCWEALDDFIGLRQRANPLYCADFGWLYEESLRIKRSAPASGEIPLREARHLAAVRSRSPA